MNKPTLEEHTIKVLNEQCIARKQENKYITTSKKGHYGDLVFTFSKNYPSHSINVFYRLDIVLNSSYGNCIKIYHRMESEAIKVLYEYISKKANEFEHRNALELVKELNTQKADIECTIK